MQKERQPEYFWLYSLRGYQYCDLLLSRGRYADATERAGKTLEWVTVPTRERGNQTLLVPVRRNAVLVPTLRVGMHP